MHELVMKMVVDYEFENVLFLKKKKIIISGMFKLVSSVISANGGVFCHLIMLGNLN